MKTIKKVLLLSSSVILTMTITGCSEKIQPHVIKQQAPKITAWESASNGEIPRSAIAYGREANGQKLYICRAHYGNGGLHIGKIRPEFKGCNIGYGGSEITVRHYEVYTKKHALWANSTNSSAPKGAKVYGYESPKDGGDDLVVCRARYKGGIQPGKKRTYWNKCFIGYGGREIQVREHDVLITD